MSEFETLLRLVESLAALRTEGRLTLLRFAGGWRVGLGHVGVGDDLLDLPVYASLQEALRALIIDQTEILVEP
jgi:hypothetical protein